MSTTFRWVAEPGHAIKLIGAPLIMSINRSGDDPLMKFVMAPVGIGAELHDFAVHINSIVRTETGMHSVEQTVVPWRSVEEIIKFVQNFSDDPVCTVIADALREGTQVKTVIMPMEAPQ